MKPTVKVSWSGGKDSTCAVLIHFKELQDKVKADKPENHTPLRNHEWFL